MNLNGAADPDRSPADRYGTMDPEAHGTSRPADASGGFQLLRQFTLATLVAFIAVAAALVALQRREELFFDQVQTEQRAAFAQAQATLARQHEDAARASLLAVHEAAHVNLTRLVANTMWAQDIGPFVARAQAVALEPCEEARRKACAAARNRRILALPGFEAVDNKAYKAMKATTVFKIKVWDLRGLAVYSSEHVQVGDDGSANAGWRAAAAGRPASELTHRDRFSAFEGQVENRDLISSYVPVRSDDGSRVVGVVELYSDVTPFLAEIRAASRRFSDLTSANEATVAERSRRYAAQVTESSGEFLVIMLALLGLLYGVSLVIVARGQRQIDRHALDQEQAARREALWHREKMAALATMAANVSHEVGNQLAVISGVAQELPGAPATAGAAPPAARILEQTARIASMMRKISDFASARGTRRDWVDVNPLVKALCDFHAFDRRFQHMPIRFVPGAGLPACLLAPDHLNEVLMALLQSLAEAASARGGHDALMVSTAADGDALHIEMSHPAAGTGLDDCPRLPPVRRRVAELGGTLTLWPGYVRLRLPVGQDAAA